MLTRTSSHICGRWYLPMFLFRDGLFLLIYRTSLIALLRWPKICHIIQNNLPNAVAKTSATVLRHNISLIVIWLNI